MIALRVLNGLLLALIVLLSPGTQASARWLQGIATGTTTTIATRTVNADATTDLPATAFWTFGVPVKKGDVPTGNILTADLAGTSVPLGCVARRTHPDGSLAWADCSVNLSGQTITHGTSKDLHLVSKSGTWPSSNHRTDADWQGLNDTVEITNLSTTSGTADLSSINTGSNFVTYERSGSGFGNGSAAWYASGDATTIASSGTLPSPLAAATTYGLCQIVASPTHYVFYDSPAHAAAGGASCNNATGLITLTSTGTCSTVACTLSVTPEADMSSGNLWKCPFDNTATVVSYGDDQNVHRVTVRANCVDQTSSSTHRFLHARMDYDVFENANTTLGPIASRGPFIENMYGFKNNPSEFDYDVTFKRNGVSQRSQAGVQQSVFSSQALTKTTGLRDWSANDPLVWISQSYAQTRATKKIQPFADGIVSTYPTNWSVSAINTSTGVFTSTGFGFLGNSGGSSTNLAIEFTWSSQPTGLTSGVAYWSCKVTTNTFTIYDTKPHAVAASPGCSGGTGQVIPSTSGSSVLVRNAIAPDTTSQMDTQLGAGGGLTDDLSLHSEWGAQYHVGNTQEFQRLSRVVATSIGNFTYGILNDSTNKVPCLTIAAQCPAGLGTHKESTYWSGCSGPIVNHTSNDIGGGGCWTGASGPMNGWDSCHWPSPVYAIWLMEGGPYFRDLLYLNANRAIGQQTFLADRNFVVGPTTYYGTTLFSNDFTSARCNVWGLRDKLFALFAAPDGSDEQAYFHQLVKNDYDLYPAETATFSANLQAMGFYAGTAVTGYVSASNFMEWYSGTVAGFGAMVFGDDATIGTNAQLLNNNLNGIFLSGLYAFCPYFADAYHWIVADDAGNFMSSWSGAAFVAGSDPSVSYNSATNVVTINQSATPYNYSTINPTNGDRFRPSKYDSLYGPIHAPMNSPPSPFSTSTFYYINNVTISAPNLSFILENSPGSGAIVPGSTVSNSGSGGFQYVQSGSPAGCPASGTEGNEGGHDVGYISMSITALGTAAVAGNSNAATAFTAALAKFTTNWNAHAAWSAQATP